MSGLNSWGRLPLGLQQTKVLQRHQLRTQVMSTASGLPYGRGRSYGDVCLNPQGHVWQTHALDRFIQFDAQTGRLVCEAGVLLKTIQDTFIPRGWCLAVTPGTQLITVGGAIANDVHGKNHHQAGSFGQYVVELQLLRTTGELIVCNAQQQADWLQATIGGMGLTGVILQAEIQLQPIKTAYLETETLAYGSLGEFFHLADQSEQDWEQTVAWVDCLAGEQVRGLLMRARAAKQVSAGLKESMKRPLTIPFTPSVSLVNRFSLQAFNNLYFQLKQRKMGIRLEHYAAYSYPLDHIAHWNRLYGAQGFYQYQVVVPRVLGQEAISIMLKTISQAGEGSFLAVLKTFGRLPSKGLMSFPQEGVTLALDFPNRGQKTAALFERLDAIVREACGRIYPAKDARMPKTLFQQGYPNLEQFLAYRDPNIQSGLARRLMDI